MASLRKTCARSSRRAYCRWSAFLRFIWRSKQPSSVCADLVQRLSPGQPALVRSADAVPQHVVADIADGGAAFGMRIAQAPAGTGMPERAWSQHRFDAAVELI